MLADVNSPLKRIAVFYDGTFFMSTSHYYKYAHSRQSYISFLGIHEYIRNKVAEYETASNVSLCQIVESHFFRGRFSLNAAKVAGAVESDRWQDQLIMLAGIVSHHYPMNEKKNPPEEKGIDVWLALEAYDLAVHKRFDIMVLFAGDQDYVPLVRKVNSLGTRVLIIGVDIEYEDSRTQLKKFIKTSPSLFREASYVAVLSEDIDSKKSKGDRIIDGIFSA